MTKEETIKKFIETLHISRQEAIQLWEDDNSNEALPEVKAIEEKAKLLRRYEKSDKPRKSGTKERKIDPDKLFLITKLYTPIFEIDNAATRKNEAEINFNYNNCLYTIKLIKHRENAEKT